MRRCKSEKARQIVRRACISVLFAVASPSVIAALPRFALTGMTDANVEAFFLKLQYAVDIHDVKTLATMVSYPLVCVFHAIVNRVSTGW